MLKIKICGITNLEDALAAVEFGADALGFVFYSKSPRRIEPEKAKEIIKRLPPFVSTVGVFVDQSPDTVKDIMTLTGCTVAQFHGEESPEYCRCFDGAVKAIRVRELSDLEPLMRYKVSAFLLDTYSPDIPGGTGQIFNWEIAVEAKRMARVILAGGLTPDNVSKAVKMVRPYAVDVSSGIERAKGIKDLEKLRLFIKKARGF